MSETTPLSQRLLWILEGTTPVPGQRHYMNEHARTTLKEAANIADRLARYERGALLRSDPEALARKFHDTYESLAPLFGYRTRENTKGFDPSSPNGKLMIEVCKAIIEDT